MLYEIRALEGVSLKAWRRERTSDLSNMRLGAPFTRWTILCDQDAYPRKPPLVGAYELSAGTLALGH